MSEKHHLKSSSYMINQIKEAIAEVENQMWNEGNGFGDILLLLKLIYLKRKLIEAENAGAV